MRRRRGYERNTAGSHRLTTIPPRYRLTPIQGKEWICQRQIPVLNGKLGWHSMVTVLKLPPNAWKHFTPTETLCRTLPRVAQIICAKGVTHETNNPTIRLGIVDAEIDLEPGRIVEVVGPNASGKTSIAVCAQAVLARDSNPLGLSAAESKRNYPHDGAEDAKRDDTGRYPWF